MHFSTNIFYAVKKIILSTAESEKKLSRDGVIAARHVKIPHAYHHRKISVKV